MSMQDVWKPAIDLIASVPNANTVRVYRLRYDAVAPHSR